jgi:hypothetical protein
MLQSIKHINMFKKKFIDVSETQDGLQISTSTSFLVYLCEDYTF